MQHRTRIAIRSNSDLRIALFATLNSVNFDTLHQENLGVQLADAPSLRFNIERVGFLGFSPDEFLDALGHLIWKQPREQSVHVGRIAGAIADQSE